ncbi:hypothetical protein BJ969_003430 [Saccharopolyspora gloriosae]|uniref:Uncharacterized protein n=1 Tax=Saccharopolyspora gloriosae TaxID=455344 RepID=A0A840NML6_9PSEU|nr:hypothetical protein [Saccharopolyspora gloriosae]
MRGKALATPVAVTARGLAGADFGVIAGWSVRSPNLFWGE